MSDSAPLTDEEFIKLFGCDRESYNRILYEHEYRILKERDNQADEILTMATEDAKITDEKFIEMFGFHRNDFHQYLCS